MAKLYIYRVCVSSLFFALRRCDIRDLTLGRPAFRNEDRSDDSRSKARNREQGGYYGLGILTSDS